MKQTAIRQGDRNKSSPAQPQTAVYPVAWVAFRYHVAGGSEK
jgi:hypothetical protein